MNIKKTILKIAIGLVIFLGALNTAYALNDYTVLSPLPGTFTGPCPATGCTTDLKTYLPGIFNFAIGLAAIMAFVMITYGGVMYMTSDAISGKSQGKEYITNAIYGLVLVIGSWVILHTINPKILQFNLIMEKPSVASNVLDSVGLASDNVLRANLALSGIGVNKSACQGTNTSCTNVVGLPTNVFTGLSSIAKDLGCSPTNFCLVVTGGTEGGHATHGVGQPIVDLSPMPNLNQYLGVTSPVGNLSPTGQKQTPTTVTKQINGQTVTFTYENMGDNGRSTAPHWHAVFK